MLQLPEPNVCKARNAGLDYSLAQGYPWLAMIDDDDHYLAGWLELVDAHAKEGRITGARPHTVVDDQGVFQTHYEPAVGVVEWVNGGTQAYSADVARRLRYPITPYGEDVMFCLLGRQIGIETYDVGPGEWLYDRRGKASDHAWPRDARQHLAYFAKVSPLEGDLDHHKNPPGHGAPLSTSGETHV